MTIFQNIELPDRTPQPDRRRRGDPDPAIRPGHRRQPLDDPGAILGREPHFTRNLKSALLAAAVVLTAAIAGLMFGISKGHDQLALDTSQRMVEGGLKGFEERVLSLTRDYAFWDDFYRAALRDDVDWMYTNVAAKKGTESDISVVIAPNGRADFGWRSDVESAAPRPGLVPGDTLALLHEQLERVPVTDRNGYSTFARIDGDVWLLAMSRVVPWNGIAPETPDNAIPRLVMGKRLSPEVLAEIGAPFLIHDLGWVADGAPRKTGLALRDARGTFIGSVSWTAPSPGARVLASIGLPVALITLVTVFVLVVAAFTFVGTAHRLENALIREQKANRAKSEFVATVSHELRTPVTSIMGSLELISSGALAASPEKTAEILAIAKNNSRRLAALIEDLLQIQKMETGNLDYHFAPVQIGAAVERAIELTRPIASNFEVGITAAQIDPALHVRADLSRLEQVLTNILSNAIKFSHKGGDVLVEVAETPSGIRVSVTDHGIGIPQGAHDRVFAPFSQIDSSDTRKTGGTGLGLNIAKRIMDAHRGLIGFDSVEGEGSTFYIEMPRVSAPA